MRHQEKRTFFVALSCSITNATILCRTFVVVAVLQVTGSSGLAKVGRGTGELAPVSRSIPILPRLQKEQT